MIACPPDHSPRRKPAAQAVACFRAAETLEQRPAALDRKRLQSSHVLGQPRNKGLQLVEKERHDQHQGQDEEQYEDHQDQERRSEAPDAGPLEPIGDRVEEVRERQPGDEGQEDVAQHVEREHGHDQRAQPERDLPLGHHRPCPRAQAAMWRSHLPR